VSSLVAQFELLPGTVQDFLASVLIGLVISFVVWLFRAKVVIRWGRTSLNYHTFREPSSSLEKPMSTQKFFIHNSGRKPASSVELVLSAEPTSYRLTPNRAHDSSTLPDGQYSLRVPSVAPKEILVVDLLDLDVRGPQLISVNCPDVLTKQVNFITQRQYPQRMYWLVFYLMSAGLIGTVYFILQIVSGD
jgi:hypothetical protein